MLRTKGLITMNPGKWKVNLNHIFMFYKSADLSPGFITMQGQKYSHICNLWGKFLPAGMICTTTDTISIPVGAIYLHARMFCALAQTSSIPMGAINFYMQECFLHSLIRLLYPWVWCIYMQECCDVFTCM